jgi:hypothetical protein
MVHGRLTRQSTRTGKANGSEPTALRSRRGILANPGGLGRQLPLTPEYQAIFEASHKQLAAGDPTARCIPPVMPRMMMPIHSMETVIMPDTTYIMIETSSTLRHIFADRRARIADAERLIELKRRGS